MKKRIAIFINSLYGGGAEKVLQTILRNLDYSKYNITLYSVKADKIGLEYPEDITYRTIYKSVGQSFVCRFLSLVYNKICYTVYEHLSPRLFYYLFVNGKYDVEIAFIEGYATRIVSGSTNEQSRKLAWVHIDLKDYPWTLEAGAFKSFMEEQYAYKKYDKVVCVSHSVEKIMKNYYDLKNTIAVYNPIDVELIKRESQKPSSFTPSDGFNIVSVGRLTSQKGFDRLIPIISRLRKEGHNVNLYILGEGPERNNLEALIRDPCIHLLGYLDNPHSIVCQMDLFVCSSRAEGYSLVIAEALSLGVPVLSTNCAGPNELLGKCEYGLLVENNVNSLYAGIKKIMTNNYLLTYYSRMAVERAKDFHLDMVISQIEEIL